MDPEKALQTLYVAAERAAMPKAGHVECQQAMEALKRALGERNDLCVKVAELQAEIEALTAAKPKGKAAH